MTEPAMNQIGQEIPANEVPSMPPAPAEHMPPVPDPMFEIEPLLQVLGELHEVMNRAAQTVQDLKWNLGGLVITASRPEPLRAPEQESEGSE